MDKIILKDVTKTIKGVVILNNINLELDRGGVYGFYGTNGSGKTMLFRAIAGLIHVTKGKITVFGDKLDEDISFPPNIGIIIESVGFWGEYTGFKNLKILAMIKKKIDDNQIKNAIKRVGLDPDDSRAYRKYSLGMKQRLALAQAIMEFPDLLVLDEPTNALDEYGIELFYKIVREEQQRGATILISSHNYSDLSKLCSRKFKMSSGTLLEETENKI